MADETKVSSKRQGCLAWNQQVNSCYSYRFCYIFPYNVRFISFAVALTTANFISCISICLNSISPY